MPLLQSMLKQCCGVGPFQEDSIFQRFVVGPRSKQQMIWSTVGAIWIVWDLCPACTCTRFASLGGERADMGSSVLRCCHFVGGSWLHAELRNVKERLLRALSCSVLLRTHRGNSTALCCSQAPVALRTDLRR